MVFAPFLNGSVNCMVRISLVLLYFAIPLAAQSWDVVRGLKAGDLIKVQDTAGKEQKGRFRSASADAISIETGKKEVSIERAKVRRVQVKSGSRRMRNVTIGAGIGFAVGLITDQTLGTYLRNEYGEGGGG